MREHIFNIKTRQTIRFFLIIWKRRSGIGIDAILHFSLQRCMRRQDRRRHVIKSWPASQRSYPTHLTVVWVAQQVRNAISQVGRHMYRRGLILLLLLLLLLTTPRVHPFAKQHIAQQFDAAEVIQGISRPCATIAKAGHPAVVGRHPQLEAKLGRGIGIGRHGQTLGKLGLDALEGRGRPLVVRSAVGFGSPLLDAVDYGLGYQVGVDGGCSICLCWCLCL